jgi:hypothetical protein
LLANTVNIAFKDQNENVQIFDKMLKKDVDSDILCGKPKAKIIAMEILNEQS